MKELIFTGLDVGSSMIHVVVGQLDAEGKMQIIGGASHPSDGINKGSVVSVEDAVASISKCLEKAERMIGRPIDNAVVGISGINIKTQDGRGVIAVTKADGEISEDEVERVLDAARTVVTPINYEILHNIPIRYNVDDQKGIKDPVGMSGNRLEVESLIIESLTVHNKNLTKAIFRAGLDITDLVYNGLAIAGSVLDKRQKELGVAVVDLGASTTTITVYEEGTLILTKVLPIGAGHITNDIAVCLRVQVDLAEKIKLFYGTALPAEVDKKEEINLAEIDERETDSIMKKELANVIEARVEEIFKLIDQELQIIGRSGKLPAGIVLTGGGAKLNGIIEVAKKQFRLPVSIGTPQRVSRVIDKVDDPSFVTATGLVLWGNDHENYSGPGIFGKLSGFSGGATRKIKKWFKSLT
ncbi:MAG: cell division protein FtsA [Patescibacteria group bacterium]